MYEQEHSMARYPSSSGNRWTKNQPGGLGVCVGGDVGRGFHKRLNSLSDPYS